MAFRASLIPDLDTLFFYVPVQLNHCAKCAVPNQEIIMGEKAKKREKGTKKIKSQIKSLKKDLKKAENNEKKKKKKEK